MKPTSLPRLSTLLLFLLALVVLSLESRGQLFVGDRRSATSGRCPSSSAPFVPFPRLSDDFSHPSTTVLGLGESAETRYALEDGAYVIEVRSPDQVAWSLLEGDYEDLSIQVETRMRDEVTPTASGIIFRYQDAENFYLFNVSNEGMYNLELVEDNHWTPLIPWTPSEALVQGGSSPHPFATNVLRVDLAHDHIALSVNGRELEVTRDGTLLRGSTGLAVNTFDRRGTVVYFDNLVLSVPRAGNVSAE